ncbi:ABC transporter permease [Rhizobium laguerreae]|nr:ABC transporter permease [Rhizobium laguerreae]
MTDPAPAAGEVPLARQMASALRGAVIPVLFFIAVIGLWEATTILLEIPEIVLPSPSAIGIALWKSVLSPTFLYHLGITLWEVIAGFVLGAVIGIAAGIAVGLFPFAERTLYPYIVAFQALPKVSVAPIIMIWFGYGLTSKIVLTATMSFFPLLANTIAGMRATPPDQKDLFHGMTANRWQIFWKLNLPLALPFIFVGLDLSLLLSVTGAIVGEFVGARAGLGFLILQRNFSLDMPGNFAILVVLAAIGLFFHLGVKVLEKKVIFWR